MKKLGFLTLLIVCLFAAPYSAHANGRLIDDVVFDNINTMSEQQIRDFINSRPSSCLAQSGAIFPEPITYFQYGGNVDAARVIYNSARYSDVNPQVILTTLQKEQTLITRTNCFEASGIDSRNKAMGMGCPDSGPCPAPAYAGFHQQLMKGTWQLGFNRQRAVGNIGWGDNDNITYSGYMTRGNFKRCASCQTIYYDGYGVVDGRSVYMETAATASLYTYTPHLGQSFPGIFEGWFGSIYGRPYDYISSSSTPYFIEPEQVISTSITVRNNTNQTWYADGSVPAGQAPTRLTTIGYANSQYANPADPSWLGTRNQVRMTTSSVPSGGWAVFNFSVKGPYYDVGPLTTSFTITIDGKYSYPSIGMAFVNRTKLNPFYSYVSASSPPSLMELDKKYDAALIVRNTGNTTWYSDDNIASGARATRLVFNDYRGTSYADAQDMRWLGTNNQVKMYTPSAPPGGNAEFRFRLHSPISSSASLDKLTIAIDGIRMGPDIQMRFNMRTPEPVISYSYMGGNSPPTTMSSGSTHNATIVLRNNGNFIWKNEETKVRTYGSVRLVTSQPNYRNSLFAPSANASWLNTKNQIKMVENEVTPGQNATFSFPWIAPTAGSYREHFTLVLDGVKMGPDLGMEFYNIIR